MATLNGHKALMRFLEQAPRQIERDAERVVRRAGSRLNRTMVRNARFKGPYTVGDTRRSITLRFNGRMEAAVRPHTHYAPYVEYGTRFMGSQPFVRPSFYSEMPKFIEDMRKLVR